MRRSSDERPEAQPTPDAGTGATARRLGLVAASSGVFLGSLDITLNVALPDIAASFSTDLQTVQWMILFYVGSSAGLQLSLGSAADVYGLRRFFIAGLAVYTVAVLLIGLAPQLSMLFGLRVLQAVGNALLMACAPALVTSLYPASERGRALGTMAGLGTLGMLVGAVVGGGWWTRSDGGRCSWRACRWGLPRWRWRRPYCGSGRRTSRGTGLICGAR